MLQVIWRAEAREIEHMTEQLPAHPFLFRPGRVGGTRKAVVHPNYVLAYRVGEIMEILSVLHARHAISLSFTKQS